MTTYNRMGSPKATSTTPLRTFAADMKAACRWGPAIDAACGPVLPPDAGRLLHGTARTYANTLQVRDAAGAFRNRVAGVRGRRHRLELVGSVRRSGLRRRPRPVHGQRHGRRGVRVPARRGAAVDRLANAKALQARSQCCRGAGRGPGSLFVGVRPERPPARECQAPSRAGREVPATRSDSSVIIATAGATGMLAYPVNLIDEYDGTVLVTSPDFPELTTFGAVRAAPLAHAVRAIRGGDRVWHRTLGWTFRHRRPPGG